MKIIPVAALLLLIACPALGRELTTTKETAIHEKPDHKSRVLAKLPANVRVQSDERKKAWFHVTATIDGKQVAGWAYRLDVATVMGRSKGQLLAENKSLFAEVNELRKTVKQLRAQLEQTGAQSTQAAEKGAQLTTELAQVKAELTEARSTIGRLQAALAKTNKTR